MSTYLVALIARPYAAWTDTYIDDHEIPLGIYCRASLTEYMGAERLPKPSRDSASTTSFGLPYAFGRVRPALRPRIQRRRNGKRRRLRRTTSSAARSPGHPMSGARRPCCTRWPTFGDLVTMTWWDDLWLNESFATFASVLVP